MVEEVVSSVQVDSSVWISLGREPCWEEGLEVERHIQGGVREGERDAGGLRLLWVFGL